MTDDELKNAKGCFWFLFYGVIIGCFVFLSPKDKSHELYDFSMGAGVISCVVAVGHFLIWRWLNPDEEEVKKTNTYTAPPPIIEKRIPYILPYKSHCYNCKQSIHSSYNTYCDKCEHFRCNGCGRCFCNK